jgi:hypothetical protein
MGLTSIPPEVKDRLSVTPEPRNGINGFRVTGDGACLKFFEEISTAPQAVASPTRQPILYLDGPMEA